ncbi:hypothetical protein B566_EDAN016491 [Ephemera danica]|nr:hypothetical protein B566_EDAN016491 [Ephemera danica]
MCPTVDESLQKAWSRGQFTTGNGNNLESCSVLTPSITPLSNISFNSGASPSSQMGCRELAGFSLFCKEMRPQILKSEPGIVFTAVAQRLARQWKELPLVDKERYGELAKQFKLARKLHPIQKCPSPQVQTAPTKAKKNFQAKNLQQPASNKDLQTVPSAPANQSPKLDIQTNVKPKSKPVKQKKEVHWEEEHVTVVGQVEKFWLLKEGSSMVMMCPWVMQEVLVLEDLKTHFVLPVAELDSPLPISSSEIGWQYWQTLSALESQWDVMSNSTKINSPLITSNGFHIRVTREEGFGLNELKEILGNISKNPDCTLALSRPEIVLKFMEEKATQSGLPIFEKSTNAVEVEDMLHHWQLQNLNKTSCHHGKDFFLRLIAIEKEENGAE